MMISHIRGRVIERAPGTVIIDVSGVGYRVFVSSHTHELLSKAPDVEVSLWTYLSVRETALDLFGFVEQKELDFFQKLVGIPGIGPKSALAILSLTTVDTLEKSIISGDTTYLIKVSGIGKKSASKIVLELKDKLGSRTDGDLGLKEESDAIDALRSLGYSLKESREALRKVGRDVADTAEKVKAALKILSQ